MKKVVALILMLACVISSVFINLNYNKSEQKRNDKLEFADVEWTRAGNSDTEFIGFNSNGSFYYYCSCGNPVNDSDLCDTYTYNDDTKIISLSCTEETYDMVTEIKVISYDGDSLVLDFDGDIREFELDEDEIND